MSNRRVYAVVVDTERVYVGTYKSAFTVYSAVCKALSVLNSPVAVSFVVDFDYTV